jgi:uncharacterized protein (DUF4415 family)
MEIPVGFEWDDGKNRHNIAKRNDVIRIISARRARKMKKENTVTRKWGDRRKGKTDWARVDALTDEDIAKAVANDPDAVPIDIDWSDAVLVIPAKKKAISIRVDEDVLNFFKKQGDGYQRRINAVLRS